MSLKAEVSGQMVITDQNDASVVFSKQLSQMFKSITGLNAVSGFTKRQILDDDNTGSPIPLDLNGVAPVKGCAIWIESGNGSLFLRHGGNSVGMQIDSGFLVFGSLTLPTIKSVGATTNPITFWYLFF